MSSLHHNHASLCSWLWLWHEDATANTARISFSSTQDRILQETSAPAVANSLSWCNLRSRSALQRILSSTAAPFAPEGFRLSPPSPCLHQSVGFESRGPMFKGLANLLKLCSRSTTRPTCSILRAVCTARASASSVRAVRLRKFGRLVSLSSESPLGLKKSRKAC